MNYPEKLSYMTVKVWQAGSCFDAKCPMDYTKGYFHRINTEIDMHSHSFWELNIITEGSGRHYINDSYFDAEEGMLFVIPPGVFHGYMADEYLSIYHILISTAFMEHYHEEMENLPGYRNLFGNSVSADSDEFSAPFMKFNKENMQELLPVFGELAELQNSNYSGYTIMKNALVLKLISVFCKKISSMEKTARLLRQNPHSTAIIDSMDYIRQHFSEKISLHKLADRFKMSYSTFLRHFDTVCGIAPGKFLQRCRIENACEMLLHTDKSVMDIALDCGYYDSAHFIRAFTETTGQSPLNYRNSNK